jgi:cytochrome c-type biogenesis protein CcmE
MFAVGGLIAGLALASWLGFTAMRKNLMYFYTPSDVVSGKAPAHAKMRLGGLVERGSVARGKGLVISFILADCVQKVAVSYEGILPDLFREGQGIVATGHVEDGRFVAEEVLAKHDENYMPPELASSLKTDAGHSCMPFKPVEKPVTAAAAS